MKISTKYNFGDIVYIGHDPKQRGYEVVGIRIKPGDAVILELDYLGDIIEMHDFQVSHERDVLKSITSADQNDD